ncbi:MAG TPA: hypothetical protein VN703_04755 [Candidatus Sulfopaludibacter sp.]|jgi:hypothetical protein|nr:hypothetical protein [Candidatus Sulfopaludibacter sp.]
MPTWKKDAKEFEVGVNYVETRGYSSSIPKPIMNLLDNPKRIKFIIKDDNKTIEVKSGEQSL